jgi:LIM domain kinase 1
MSFLSRCVLPGWAIRRCVSCPRPQDIRGDWKKLGSGSFGNVYKGPLVFHILSLMLTDTTGSYLGIDVAIKEVLPSSNYDVAKYFEREWRLMK